jgi:hypothetical protein
VKNLNYITNKFSNLNEQEQKLYLSKLSYIITVISRDSSDYDILKLYNEIQHRVASQLYHTLRENTNKYPEDIFFSIIDDEIKAINTKLDSKINLILILENCFNTDTLYFEF